MKKIFFILALVLLCVAGFFFNGHHGSSEQEQSFDTTDFNPTIEVDKSKYAVTELKTQTISDSVITKTYEEFEQRTLIEHVNTKKLRPNMIGAHMYANCKPENFVQKAHSARPNKFVIDVYAKHPGAYKFYGCKVLIGEKVYELSVDQQKNLGGGRFVGACLVRMYSDDIIEPLARATSAKVKFLFDNGSYEATLSKRDLQVYSDMYYIFRAHNGEITSI